MADIDELRYKPVGHLTADEREALFSWLLANGLQAEYDDKLAEVRLLERRLPLPQKPTSRALLSEPVTESEVTMHGTPIRLKVQTYDESTQTSTATSMNREDSTVQLEARDKAVVLPPTEEHLLSDLASSVTETRRVERENTVPSALLAARPRTGMSAFAVPGDTRATAAIIRPKYEPRKVEIDVNEETVAEEPPPLPPQVFQRSPQSHSPSEQSVRRTLSREATWDSPSAYSDPSLQSPQSLKNSEAQVSVLARWLYPKARLWPLVVILGVVLVCLFALAREHERLRVEHRTKLKQVESSFRSGNDGDLTMGLSILESQDVVLGFTGALLDIVLPLVGQPSLRDRFIKKELKSELKLRSTQIYLFKDESALPALVSLIDEAIQRGVESQDVQAARALLDVSTRSLKDASSGRVELSVSDGHSAWVQAVLNESMGHLKIAEKYLRSAMSLDFDHPYAGLSLAGLLARRGDRLGALNILDQILNARPQFTLARLAAARLGLKLTDRRRFAQQELESLHASRTLAPTERNMVAVLLADEEIRTGQFAAAQLRLSKVLSGGGHQEDVVRRLAGVYFQQSKLDDVKKLLSTEFWLPDETKLELSSELFLMMGLPDEALQRLNRLTVKTRKSEILLNEAIALKLLLTNDSPQSRSKKIMTLAKSRLAQAKEEGRMEPSIVLIEALMTSERTLLLTTARQQLKRAELPSIHRLLSWRFVVAWGRLQNREFERGTRLLSAGKKMRALTAPELWLKCQLESKRLRLKSSVDACTKADNLSAFEPARSTLADILEQRADYEGVVTVLTQSSKRIQMEREDGYRLARAYYFNGDGMGLAGLGAGQAITVDEGVSLFAHGLGEVLGGQVEDGLSRLRRSVVGRERDARTLTLVGGIFAQHKRPREAQKLFESAMTINKEPFQRIGLARLLMEHGQLTQALEVARAGERLAQSSLSQSGLRAHAVALQAQAYMRLKGRRNLARARSLLRKAKRISQLNPVVLIASGLYFEKTGKKDKAKDEYLRVLEMNEHYFEAQYRLGRILLSQRRTQREGRALLESLSRAPSQTVWSEKARGLLP